MSDLTRFLPAGTPAPFAALLQLTWILQIALVIHVYRTGRPYWWTWVLFAAPVVGGLAYLIIEILPGLKSPQGFFYALKPRRWKIADLREELEETDTVVNRINLAELLFEAGEIQEAYVVAAACLKGVFQNDPRTLVEVARYSIALKDYAQAYALLQRVDTTGNRMLALKLDVLKGDALFGLERYTEAEAAYENASGKFIGEAPRVGLACIYEKTGRPGEATGLWKEIQKKFRKASPAWRRTERRWYKLAGLRLAAQKK